MSSVTTNLDFFEKMLPVRDYRHICDLQYYHDAPADWLVIICDIQGSTKAIADGKYKEVNFIGAACIMAMVNALKGVSIPYAFGGDGATLLIPSEFRIQAEAALASLQKLSRSSTGLNLRIGVVPVAEVLAKGLPLKVGRFAISKDISIALFAGRGFFESENWVKGGDKYLLAAEPDSNEGPNLDGLECRWESFPSTKGEILTVLVKATVANPVETAAIYQEVIEEIDIICGTREQMNPATTKKLKFPSDMAVERKFKSAGKTALEKIKLYFKYLYYGLGGRILLGFNVKTKLVDWGDYKDEVIANSDFWKFDETLRFVFDVSPPQKRAMIACLENKKREGKIFFGTHSSSAAMMTCLVFDRRGDHVHFIDGADGGYALAAVQLKAEIKKAEETARAV